MRLFCIATLGLLGAASLGGCAVRQGPASASGLTNDANFNAAWDAAIQTLRQYRFEVDRTDPRAGEITTLPLLGRHWFEFWRKDAATEADVAEGTVQTVWRQATVTITRKGSPPSEEAPPAEYDVAVVIETSRSDRPTAQVTSTSEAIDMFRRPRAMEAPDARSKERIIPVPLGRDANLEQVLLAKIQALAAKKQRTFPK